MGKASYLLKSIFRRFSSNKCPACGSSEAKIVDTKIFGLTTLLQCSGCHLRYRFPQDSVDYNYQFYQNNYVQHGLTTDLPNESELCRLVEINFINTEKDFSRYNKILNSIAKCLQKRLNILDYGANWGYSCHQFKLLDCVENAYGYELSAPRRSYGETNLGIEYIQEASELKGVIDVLFSSHVIEHMSNPVILKEFADTVLAPGGIVLLVCPNGSDASKLKNIDWSLWWGEAHPNFISDQYLCGLFSDYNGIVADIEYINKGEYLELDQQSGISSRLPTNGELLMIAKKVSHN